jgi:hypothetical protein
MDGSHAALHLGWGQPTEGAVADDREDHQNVDLVALGGGYQPTVAAEAARGRKVKPRCRRACTRW